MAEIREWDVCRWIEPFIYQLTEGDIQSCVGRASVKDFTSSAHPSGDDIEENDIFNICVPYAGLTLQWQVLFNGFNPDELPDFLIPDYDGFDPDYEDIPHLVNWDPKNPQSLLNVIADILSLYREHHLKVLSKTDEKLSKGVDELMKSKEYPLIDTCVSQQEGDRYNSTRHNISVLIRIDMDSSEIPDICFKDAPPEDPSFVHPVLLVRTANSGKIIPQLYMPPRMEQYFVLFTLNPSCSNVNFYCCSSVLGGRNAMKLPSYSRQNTDLFNYVQTVHRNLYELVAILRDGHSKRREYVAAFLCQCPDNVVEYDAEDFANISLLFSYEDFYFIVHVTLGKMFPQEQPKLVFQSVYHVTKRGKLYQINHSSYPYSPRWPGNEMVKRTRSYILDRIEAFKTGCMKNGTI